jgi:A/G-specific adenine glycosylase
VLVSEVMLQQTQAARVVPIFRAFVRRFPSVADLAAAPVADVVRAWAGLGYNRRAVALSRAARWMVRENGGDVPSDPDTLIKLPGIGPYTASAVAAIAFGARVPAMDTNVRRVVARAALGLDHEQAPSSVLRGAARRLLGSADPAAWNQAVMDLGREVCRPKPRCVVCPLADGCAFRRAGAEPLRTPRRTLPYERSSRQLRGAIVRALRERSPQTGRRLGRTLDVSGERVALIVGGLARDGLVVATATTVALPE